jgi:MFS family permease
MPVSLTLISDAFPVEKRGAAIGMWGAVSGVAVAIGPVVGGAVISGLNWHWIFWFNVPIGVVAGLLSLSRLTESRAIWTGRREGNTRPEKQDRSYAPQPDRHEPHWPLCGQLRAG